MVSARERRKKRVSARGWADKQKTGFGNWGFTVPEGVELFRIEKSGSRRLDFLCYRVGKGNPNADEGELHFERSYWVHRMPSNGQKYVCPQATLGKPCPICEHQAALRRDPDADKDLIKSLWPKQRQLWLVYDLDDMGKGAQLVDYSYHLFGKQLKAELDNADEEDGYDYFADLEDGLTLRVNFEENKPYGYGATSINFKKRKTQYKEELADELPCLDDLLKIEDYDTLKAAFFQIEDDEDDEDDEDEHPVASAKGKAVRRKVEQEAVDDEDDDEPAPPPKKARAKKEASPSDDDDDEDWDEDFDDDPPPKKKSKATKGKPPKEEEVADDDDDEDWE